jgi:hypothetical protein
MKLKTADGAFKVIFLYSTKYPKSKIPKKLVISVYYFIPAHNFGFDGLYGK